MYPGDSIRLATVMGFRVMYLSDARGSTDVLPLHIYKLAISRAALLNAMRVNAVRILQSSPQRAGVTVCSPELARDRATHLRSVVRGRWPGL